MARLRGRSAKGKTVTRLEGDAELLAEIKRMEKRFPEALAAAMFEEAVEIFNASQEEVPVDTGALRRSGVVLLRKMGKVFTVVIGYGTAYALRIHEDTKLDENRQHRAELALSNPGYIPRGSTVGKSKYLIDPFEAALPGMTTRLVTRTKDNVQRGVLLNQLKTVRGRGK